jgi:hypothetical protein
VIAFFSKPLVAVVVAVAVVAAGAAVAAASIGSPHQLAGAFASALAAATSGCYVGTAFRHARRKR